MPLLVSDLDILNTVLTHLTPTAILVVVVIYLVLKERMSRKNGVSNPGSASTPCPLNPPDLHQDLRDIVLKLEKLVDQMIQDRREVTQALGGVTNSISRLMGRLENGGRREGPR